jgi:hypothetical protein
LSNWSGEAEKEKNPEKRRGEQLNNCKKICPKFLITESGVV